MKYLLTAALALFATTASADLCDDLAEIGEGIVSSRIIGIPIDFWLDQIDPNGYNVEWLLAVTVAAYEIPMPSNKRDLAIVPYAFAASVEITCRQNTGPNT